MEKQFSYAITLSEPYFLLEKNSGNNCRKMLCSQNRKLLKIEMHATRFIRMETRIGVRDSDLDLIHLPSYYTKRQLYETFCYQSGWEIKLFGDGSYPPLDQFPLRKNDDNENGQELALWPEGSEPLSVCS